MRVGHGSAPLLVPNGTPMGGYAARAGASSGVLDELQVDCITFASAAGRFALVVAEVLCAGEDLAAAVRERLPVDDAWVCATHTHAGPDVSDGRWQEPIGDAAAAALRIAVASERECTSRLHTGVLRDVGSPRGDELAEPTLSLDVLTFVDADGALHGVLAVVPVHPTVLPADSTLISGDLAAAIRSALRRALGAPWVVVATGAAGDISTRRTRRAQTPEECRRLGDVAAAQIAALIRAGANPVHDRGPRAARHRALWQAGGGAWSADRRTLALPVRRRDARELQKLRATLEDRYALELRRGAVAAARTAETALQGIAIAQARRRTRTVALALSAARLGRLALFGVGAEPFYSLGEELRDRCGGPSVLLGYANGHAGYLADAAAYATTGYEVLSSPFRRDAGATALASLHDLLPDPMED